MLICTRGIRFSAEKPRREKQSTGLFFRKRLSNPSLYLPKQKAPDGCMLICIRGIRFSAEKPSDGSDNPPDCLSLPSVRILLYICQNKKHPDWDAFCFGGQRGIRTLERVLAVTRFPVVRLRPAQPSVHNIKHYNSNHCKCQAFFQCF